MQVFTRRGGAFCWSTLQAQSIDALEISEEKLNWRVFILEIFCSPKMTFYPYFGFVTGVPVSLASSQLRNPLAHK